MMDEKATDHMVLYFHMDKMKVHMNGYMTEWCQVNKLPKSISITKYSKILKPLVSIILKKKICSTIQYP